MSSPFHLRHSSGLYRLGLRTLLITVFYSDVKAAVEAKVYSAHAYGAVGDRTSLQTSILQHCIDDAHAAGGGIVKVEAGTYLIGTLVLQSGVTLDLEQGATLLGSPHIADYRRGIWPALILARDQHDVGITGRGTIDGQGTLVAQDTLRIFASGRYIDFFPGIQPGEKVVTVVGTGKELSVDPYAMQEAGTLANRVASRSREDVDTWRVDEFVRPQLLEFSHCSAVRVSGITLKNAANWVQSYRQCDNVTIERIRVESISYWNNDGVDIVNCRNVRIEDCDINSADDGICLKSEPSPEGRGCEDISIARCRIRSSASAFKLGTASYQGFRRIRVEDLEIRDTFRSAVALETVDGGTLEDVKVSRIRARNTGNAIFLRIGQRNAARPPGTLRNIELSDFEVEIPSGRPDAGYEHAGPPLRNAVNLIPSSIVGLPDRPVENVVLRNIRLTYGGGGNRHRADVPISTLEKIPQCRENYPEFSMFGELPAWGFFVRDAKGVKFENISFRLLSPDFRAAMVVDRADDLVLKSAKFLAAGEEPVLVLSKVNGEQIDDIQWPENVVEKIRRMPSR